jgi:hypothetical protein
MSEPEPIRRSRGNSKWVKSHAELVADDVARDSPRRSMDQVIQVTVHTIKRRWRVQNRRRLRIRQRPGVGLFAGPHFFIAYPSFFCAAASLLLYRCFQVSMLGIVPSGCVYSFDMYVFRLGDEILVAGARRSSRGWPRRIGRPCL